ncbi:MAG TPA: hypothetical protein VIF37_01585 [Methylobacter sp.]|jgi:hypothetical protein
MSETRYTIEARAYDIVGVVAHDFWVLRDEKGQVLGQLHGLATSPERVIKPIGTLGDKLKFYHFGLRAISFGLNPARNLNYIKSGQQSKPMFSGSPKDVLARWDNAVKALPYLNSLDVVYTPFGIVGIAAVNSNTAYHLLGKLMSIPVHYFPLYWQPGWKNAEKILTSAQIESLRYPENLADIYFA